MDASLSLGVMFRREGAPQRLPDYASRVERAGFDELWVVEDCFYLGGIAQTATALAATSSVTVGLGIAPAVARNPAFLAMEFATLADMYPNRFHGGIGHGVAEWMEQIGAKPDSWLAALEETTTAVRSILAGERVSMSGRSVRLRDVELEHAPVVAPPISLGVRGEKSLRLSGRCADGTLIAEGASPAYVRWARERIEEGQRETGETRSHRVTVYALCMVSQGDPDRARSVARRAVAEHLSDGAMTHPLPYAGELKAMVDDGGVKALAERMPDAWLSDLAVAGTPEEAAGALQRLGDAGADAVVLVPPAEVEPEAWLDDVASDLLPLIRAGGRS